MKKISCTVWSDSSAYVFTGEVQSIAHQVQVVQTFWRLGGRDIFPHKRAGGQREDNGRRGKNRPGQSVSDG